MNVRELRAAAAQAHPTAVPCGSGRTQAFAARDLRAQTTKRNGQDFYEVTGYASVVERGYQMWDWYGEYTEVMDAGAFDTTLARQDLDTVWLTNHRGVTMARTTNGTLELSADETGLFTRAYLNPKRSDVQDIVIAVDDGLVTEMSFAFMITRGTWSPDYTEYRIQEVDLHRGDVSAVNYGANPHTSVAARSAELLRTLDELPPAAQREALDRLSARLGGTVPAATPAATGRSVDLLERIARATLDA